MSAQSEPRIGVDIGGTRVKVARVSGGVTEQSRVVALTDAQADRATLVRIVSAAVEELRRDATDLGAGVAALVDAHAGVVTASPNMPWLDGFALGPALADATGMNVVLDNDVHCVGWGEAQVGAGRGVDNQVCLALGTGLGGCIIEGGQLYRGRRGRAAELGHITVAPTGPRCGCGGRGCAEQFASKVGMLRLASEVGWSAPKTADLIPALFAAAASGDARAQWVVERAARALGAVMAWCAEMLQPDRIVLAGGIAAAWQQLRPAALAELARQSRPSLRPPRVVTSTLGADAGTIGAALLGFGGLSPP